MGSESLALASPEGRTIAPPSAGFRSQLSPSLFHRTASLSGGHIWVWLLVTLAAAVAGYLVWRSTPRDVVIAHARTGPAVELIYATGFVEADQPVSVAARLTAPVMRVLVDEGDRVRRGQPLLLLDDEDQRGLLAQAKARSRGSALTERRMIALFEQGWVTRASRDQAVAAADADRAAERTADAHVGQNVIRSGIDGVVLKRDVEPGELATPTRTLMLLGDPARIRITATVDERDVARVRAGQRALMSSDAWPGRILRGHVRSVTPGGDPSQRAFRLRVALDQAVSLPIGLTVEVNIIAGKAEHAVLVPSAAVVDDHVWVIEAGRARRKAVRTGLVDNRNTELLSGLATGATVVVNPPADLTEGERVGVKGPAA